MVDKDVAFGLADKTIQMRTYKIESLKKLVLIHIEVFDFMAINKLYALKRSLLTLRIQQ